MITFVRHQYTLASSKTKVRPITGCTLRVIIVQAQAGLLALTGELVAVQRLATAEAVNTPEVAAGFAAFCHARFLWGTTFLHQRVRTLRRLASQLKVLSTTQRRAG